MYNPVAYVPVSAEKPHKLNLIPAVSVCVIVVLCGLTILGVQ